METIEEINTKAGVVRISKSHQGPVAADYLVESSGDDWEIRRWYFFDNFDQKDAKRFGVRLINNPEYRQKSLNKNVPWVLIQELYLKAEQTIVSTFEKYSLFNYSPSDLEEEIRAEWAEHKLMRMLKETYDSISFLLREFSVPPDLLEPYLETQYEAASGIAKMIDRESTVTKENVRPLDRLLECRSPSSREWIVEDDRLEILTITDAYNSEYQPVVALKSPPKKKEVIKDLSWKRTHRQWNPEREVWEIDLWSLESAIQSLTSWNHTIRVAEPVARLADIESPDLPKAVRPNWSIPTVQPNGYEEAPSATELLTLPGIGPNKARGLLKEGFGSIPEIAHSSVSQLAEAKGIGETFGEIARQGSLVAIGQYKPNSVQLARKTSLSLPEAQREIAGLAARGIPQSDSLPTLIGLYQTDLPELNSIFGRKLYSVYMEGYHSVEELADIKVSELEELEYIDREQAKEIVEEASRELT